MDLFVAGLDGSHRGKIKKHCDGKIIFGNIETVIKVNSDSVSRKKKVCVQLMKLAI